MVGMWSWLNGGDGKSGMFGWGTVETWPSGMGWTILTLSYDNMELIVSNWSVGVWLSSLDGKYDYEACKDLFVVYKVRCVHGI